MAESRRKPETTGRSGGPGGPGAPGGPGGAGGPPRPAPFPEVAGGYNGTLLRVNLTNRNISTEKLSYEFCRMYLGGAGFVSYYLWKEIPAGADPLGPDNKLVFALGPVSGISLPGAARFCVGAKSPLMGAIAKSESGGWWMAELKRAGYDAIIIEGKSDTPVYLFIEDGAASLHEASRVWGKPTKETAEIIREELNDDKAQLVMIGPGGENLVRYACIMSGNFDAAGRGGLGAVMGSKKLKAIAVRGHKLPGIENEEKLKEIRQAMTVPSPMSQTGTGGPGIAGMEASGNLPVRNFRDGLFPGINDIHAGVMKEQGILTGMDGCYACHIRCKKVVEFQEPYSLDSAYGGPEYETMASLGSDCGVDDVRAICKGNEICNANSLDTISAGSTIAFAMECYEKGLITKNDTGGLELKFGNADAMLKALELIVKREGIGDLMAEGTARMAKKIGRGCEAFAMHTKGLEPGMHEPRLQTGLGFGYMINSHGADHGGSFGSGTSPMGIESLQPFGILTPVTDNLSPQRISVYKLTYCLGRIGDCMVQCSYVPCNAERQVELLKAVCGWNTSLSELLKIGERVVTLMRLFDNKHGFTVDDDEWPERWYQPKTDGALSNKYVDREQMKKAKGYFYYYMGWDSEGRPTPEKLAELGIS